MKNNKFLNAEKIIFIVLSLMPVILLFDDNVWFDEAYTLSLIKHNFSEILEILKTDMHPPLYFFSLKLFCEIFGYSIAVTKLFSLLGYIFTLSLGVTIVSKRYGDKASITYMLALCAIPMSYYFSVQQRSYYWCIFFVTLTFLKAIDFLENGRAGNCIILAVSALAAAYNHIYALVAAGVIFAFVNIYILLKKRKLLTKILITDFSVVAGYSVWLIILLNQTKSAAGSFWLKGLEPLSVIVFAVGTLLSILILLNKRSRSLTTCFGILVILGVQAIGFSVSIIIRPLYIARYSVVVTGVFVLIISLCINNVGKTAKRILISVVCLLNAVCLIFTAFFEYNPSISNFRNSFDKTLKSSDTLLYCDNAFGVMSYYYPTHKHLVTFYEPWFKAFDNVEYIEKSDIKNISNEASDIYFIMETNKKIPSVIEKDFDFAQYDTFTSDLNTYSVYKLTAK